MDSGRRRLYCMLSACPPHHVGVHLLAWSSACPPGLSTCWLWHVCWHVGYCAGTSLVHLHADTSGTRHSWLVRLCVAWWLSHFPQCGPIGCRMGIGCTHPWQFACWPTPGGLLAGPP